MILSGKHVLFMDPRKAYLGRGQSCKKVSLEKMKRYGHYNLEFALLLIYNMLDFSLHTFLHWMATMVINTQWITMMGFVLLISIPPI